MKYKQTQQWFQISELRTNIERYVDKNKPYKILEIGCFEGISSCFFSDTLLNHEDSELHCVDPFISTDSLTAKQLGITTQCIDSETKQTFQQNISKSKWFSKIKFFNDTSHNFMKHDNKVMYDLIYIDGCHEPEYLEHDVTECFKILNDDGIMWMDDYMGNTTNDGKCCIHIDRALEQYSDQYKILHKNYQLAIKKHAQNR